MLSNKQRIQYLLLVFFLSNIHLNLFAQTDSLLLILQEELNREVEGLNQEEEPPYYMSFRVDHISRTNIVASFGNIMSHDQSTNRVFTPQIRIGDYSFDNTHEFNQNTGGFDGGYMNFGYVELPLENNKLAIQHSIWLSVDNAYKNALREFHQKKNRKTDTPKDTVNDFTKEKASVYFENQFQEEKIKVDENSIIEKLKTFSNILSADSSVFSSNVSLRYGHDRKYFISTEGASIVQNSMLSQLQIIAMVKNKEGNVIPQHFSIIGKHPEELLSDPKISTQINELMALLDKLKNAKTAEPYAGPAILSAEASGVFFHEIFGHRVEGHRLEMAYDGQTFTDKIGEKVLPKNFSVISDPTIDSIFEFNLIGSYVYDDEGVKSEKVTLVENGLLKDFLMSRKPLSEIRNSNGHGRAQIGNKPVSRQSNLIITASKTYSDKELRKRLISECKKQKKEYGYYFKSVIGGFTITDRFNPNVFNIIPSEVYRIYVDGRPDELVTGVELIGTPLTMFSNILYAGDNYGFFSGFCGAESGYIPVSAVSPAIFVKKIETQKGMEMKAESPLLPSPTFNK